VRRRTLVAAISVAAAFAGAANASAATLNVEPIKGSDTFPGTAAQPLRTLAEGLSRANSGDTVKLGTGIYHEAWDDEFGNHGLIVPKGVTIQGVADPAAGRTVLSGGGAHVGLRLLDTAKVNDVLLSDFDDGLQANRGTPTLRGVDFSASTLQLGGRVQMSVTADQPDPLATERGGAFTSLDGPAIRLSRGADITIDGAAISGGNTPTCDLRKVGIDATASHQVNTSHLQMKNLPGGALRARSSSQVEIRTTTITDAFPVGCAPAPAVSVTESVAGTISDSHVSGDGTTGTTGIAVNDKFGLSIQGSTVDGWTTGVKAGAIGGHVKVIRSQLRENSIGLSAAPSTAVDVSNSRIENNLTGIEAGALLMRVSRVTGNLGTGVLLDGPVGDLGTIADPGANVFQGNGANGSVRLASNNPSGRIDAAGNTWEPGVQGADGAGHYLTHPFVTGLSPLGAGRNFRLPVSGGASMQL
jgi:Protein of unknown function (DUF1565)